MTCSMLSAIMASTKVMNWARKPGWRIAANDRFADGGPLTGTCFISFIANRQIILRFPLCNSGAISGDVMQLDTLESPPGHGRPVPAAWVEQRDRCQFVRFHSP